MAAKKMDAKELSRVYGEVSEDSGKFKEMIEKNAMDPDTLDWILKGFIVDEQRYSELDSLDDLSATEFAKLYSTVAEDIKSSPDKYAQQVKPLGMDPGEFSVLMTQISGGIEKYPEVWESVENAQILHPRNLAMLATALKEDTAEALRKIKGIGD